MDKGTWRGVILKVHFTLGVLEWFRFWAVYEQTSLAMGGVWDDEFRPTLQWMEFLSWILSLLFSSLSAVFHSEIIMYWKATCCLREDTEEFVTWLSKISDKYSVFYYFSKAKRDKLNLVIATRILKTVLNCESITFIIFLNYKNKCNFILTQIVRSDLKELRDLDLKGAPYGYTPFCDSRKEMDGYRFWKSGYWASHLGKKKYHIR